MGHQTSCSGQFLYALARGLNRGWLDDSYRAAARRAVQGVASRVTPEGGINAVCQSTSIGRELAYYNQREKRDNDHHGVGLVLLALTEAWHLHE